MDNIPFPQPISRSQATANALFYAGVVEATVVAGAPLQPGQTAFLKAQMWSQIALTFPPDPEVDVIYSNDGPVLEWTPPHEPEPLPKGILTPAPQTPSGTMTVATITWDVLRTIAARYIHTSLEKSVVVDLNDDYVLGLNGLEIHMQHLDPNSEQFRVTLVRAT